MRKKIYVTPTVTSIDYQASTTLLAGSGKVTSDLMGFGDEAEVTDEASARLLGIWEDDNLKDFLEE